MTDENTSKFLGILRAPKAALIAVALASYVVGSIFPVGYVNYLIRFYIFPKSLEQSEPPFDRSQLKGAKEYPVQFLLSAVDENPSAFSAQFQGKPIIVWGKIQYFLDQSLGQTGQTLTLETDSDYRGIFLTFDNATDPKLIALKKGGDIRAACMVTSNDSSNVHLGHCEVLK